MYLTHKAGRRQIRQPWFRAGDFFAGEAGNSIWLFQQNGRQSHANIF